MSNELFDSGGRPIIILANPDGTELSDESGRPYKVLAGGIIGGDGAGSSTIEDTQSVTVVSGVIAPAAPASMIGNLAITGEGNTDDDLTMINAGAAFSGKLLLLRKDGSGIITVKKSASLILQSTDFVLNSVDDVLCLEWKSTNIWREHYRSNCG